MLLLEESAMIGSRAFRFPGNNILLFVDAGAEVTAGVSNKSAFAILSMRLTATSDS